MRRHQANRVVGARRAHVGLLLLAADVDVEVVGARVFADQHAFVDLGGRLDEDGAALLHAGNRVGGGHAGAVGDERAVGARRDWTVPRLPSGEDVIDDAGALGVGEALRAEADQAAGRNAELQAHAAAAVVHHLGHGALADAAHRDHHALELLGHVDHQFLDRLLAHAVDLLDDDLGTRDLHLEALSAHHFDQDRQLQFAATEHLELFRRLGGFHPD